METTAGEIAAATGTSPEVSTPQHPSRVGQITGALRAAGGTSVRLVCAIFSSLVPELPARID